MSAPSAHRSLLMKANRQLGLTLSDRNLLTVGQLQEANERWLEWVAGGERGASLLRVLTQSLKFLREGDVLRHAMEHEGAGLVDLRDFDVPDEFRRLPDSGACWATWTVPFDKLDGFTCLASAYVLSPVVKAHWEARLPGPLLWFGTTLDGVTEHLGRLGTPAR
ncbi:MAG: hypothetical protein FJ397_06110 [Verrucomicrobia bacterium]|nr:hypothetical protein [Verrucomicrobiota bacterium]